jgi:hypothetical protein
MNRWHTNVESRQRLADEKAKLLRDVDLRIKQINMEMAKLEIGEALLLEEGKELVPELREFPHCYKTLIDLVTTK